MSAATIHSRNTSSREPEGHVADGRRSIELSAGTTEYHDEGEGPVVVCLHGLLADARLYEPFARSLGSDIRVVRPELPLGCHRVPMNPDAPLAPTNVAGLVVEFLEALDLNEVTLIGNDSGGAISQMVATTAPERLARLVLTPSDAFEVFPPWMFSYFRVLPRIPGGIWATSQMMRLGALRRLPMAYGRLGKRLDSSLTGDWMSALRASSAVRRDVAKVLRGVKPSVMRATSTALADFDRPTLLVWGDDDFGFRLSLAERLLAVLPNAELCVLEDATVFLPLDQPEALAALVRDRMTAG